MPYETVQTLCTGLSGVSLGSEGTHTVTNHLAEGPSIADVAPSRDEVIDLVARVAARWHRRPSMMLAIDGAQVPTRPASAQGRRGGRKRQRTKLALWKG